MSKQEKLLIRIKAKPSDFSWTELIKLLDGFGYEMIARGKQAALLENSIMKSMDS